MAVHIHFLPHDIQEYIDKCVHKIHTQSLCSEINSKLLKTEHARILYSILSDNYESISDQWDSYFDNYYDIYGDICSHFTDKFIWDRVYIPCIHARLSYFKMVNADNKVKDIQNYFDNEGISLFPREDDWETYVDFDTIDHWWEIENPHEI